MANSVQQSSQQNALIVAIPRAVRKDRRARVQSFHVPNIANIADMIANPFKASTGLPLKILLQ